MSLLLIGYKKVQAYQKLSQFPRLVRNEWKRYVASSTNEYLMVPFEDKDEAKQLGARFDAEKKKWYVPTGREVTPFQKWMKVYLNVPYAEREEAKKHGAMWDAEQQKWFIRGNLAGNEVFSRWREAETPGPTPSKSRSSKAPKTPVKERLPVTIIDIDTTGLPVKVKGGYDKFTALASYNSARIVRLSYLNCDINNDFTTLQKQDFIIKSDGFPINNPEFHGITNEISQKQGIQFKIAAKELMNAIKDSKHLIFHNAEFCIHILHSELYRYALFEELETIQAYKPICIMERSRSKMGLLDVTNKPKAPSLKELLSLTVKSTLPDPHSSDMDVEYIRQIIQNWNTTGIFPTSELLQS